MFLAAGPYFQKRFKSNDWILKNFQPTELTTSTIVNLGSILILTNLQAKASYSKRIIVALIINIVCFTFLAISTKLFTHVSAGVYFGFLIVQVLLASGATGTLQNGIFAYVSGFGREEYTQSIMTGQAVAGVLPAIVQIMSVLSAPPANAQLDVPTESSTSAMAYFLTATGISALTLAAFLYLANIHRRSKHHKQSLDEVTDGNGNVIQPEERESVPLTTLFRKTFWLATSVFITFTVTMIYPVFTQEIESVRSQDNVPELFKPASFIPLGFLFWNSGDLIGRLLPAIPRLRLTQKPRLVLALALSRVLFIPLYLLCNVNGRGAKINSDFFYLFIVQLGFGISNGFLGSTCMMGAIEYVDVEEREATGGFMGLCLVGGLTVGSLLSFTVAG
jgi:equilibrative nucleoside transporter 1/2/3